MPRGRAVRSAPAARHTSRSVHGQPRVTVGRSWPAGGRVRAVAASLRAGLCQHDLLCRAADVRLDVADGAWVTRSSRGPLTPLKTTSSTATASAGGQRRVRPRWSRTIRTHCSFTFGSTFFGMTYSLSTQKDAAEPRSVQSYRGDPRAKELCTVLSRVRPYVTKNNHENPNPR